LSKEKVPIKIEKLAFQDRGGGNSKEKGKNKGVDMILKEGHAQVV